MPKVSVIIPNYNHKKFLFQRIESVLDQTFQDFEVIILDDCSTDGSRAIIELYRNNPKVTNIVYGEKNSGSTFKQWEKGFLLAKGDWLWIAESDDYCETIFLESLVNLSEECDNVGIVFGNSHWVDDRCHEGDELSIYKTSFFKNGLDEIKEGLSKHCTIQNASSCIIKRDIALKAIEGLGKYRACGDWIFYTRILQTANLAYTECKLNYFRWYHYSVSSGAKDRLWMTEGIDVLKNIDYRIVKFSPNEFLLLIKIWLNKIKPLNFRDTVWAWATIAFTVVRFYAAKTGIIH